LLRHIVGETLEGRTDGLKEYALGREVFHRPSGYDPRNDAIVRVQASLLRKRLAAYYEHEGSDSPWIIDLPRGGYVPHFSPRAEVPPETLPPLVLPEAAPVAPRASAWKAAAASAAAGVMVGVLGLLAWQSRASWAPAECPSLWQAYLDSDAETIVSFGVPLFYSGGGGLYVRDTEVNTVTDQPGRIDQIGKMLGRPFRPQGDVYTGIGDAIGTHSVALWLERRGVRVSVGNSNYIGRSDVEGKNLVVVASARFQTLLQQMSLPQAIHFVKELHAGGFVLDAPAAGEANFFGPSDSPGVATSYAVVSLWLSQDGRHRSMYVSGIETWSTQGAAGYVLDPAHQAELQRRLDADPPESFRGRKSPSFQVLLRVEGKNNIARSATYVTHRYLPVNPPSRP
jgi:hypothetical protein